MGELTRACELAGRLLDEPNCDSDDDLRLLSRQLLRRQEVVQRLQDQLAAQHDPTRDMIEANRDSILTKHEEAVSLLRRILDPVLIGSEAQVRKAIKVLDALSLFHPMHGESWPGWPEVD